MNQIGIRVFWGPWGDELIPSPVVSNGEVVGEMNPSVPELVHEERTWMITVRESQTVYAIHSKEPCTDSKDYLQVLACVVIPDGKKLSGGTSPVSLLEAVRNLFCQLFTMDLRAALPDEEKVNAEFEKLLSGFSLERCPWYVYKMLGTEPASFCVESEEQLNALMRFHRYTALAHIEHLELGFNCRSTVMINTKGDPSSVLIKETKKRWWKRGTPVESPSTAKKKAGKPSAKGKQAEETKIEKKKEDISESSIKTWLAISLGMSQDSDEEAREYLAQRVKPSDLKIVIEGVAYNASDKVELSVAYNAINDSKVEIIPKQIDGYSFVYQDAVLLEQYGLLNVIIKAIKPKVAPEAGDSKEPEPVVNAKPEPIVNEEQEPVINEEIETVGNEKPAPVVRKKKRGWLWLVIVAIVAFAGFVTHHAIRQLRDTREAQAFFSCNTVEDYRQYIRDYPNGAHRYQAQFYIDEFDDYSLEYCDKRDAIKEAIGILEGVYSCSGFDNAFEKIELIFERMDKQEGKYNKYERMTDAEEVLLNGLLDDLVSLLEEKSQLCY